MKIIFLGTGSASGIPTWSCNCSTCRLAKKGGKNNRSRPSLMVETGGKRLVIDTGPDFREQMLREDTRKINYALITHKHADHTASLYELKIGGKMELMIPKKVMAIYKKDFYSKGVFSFIKKRNPKIIIKNFKPFKFGKFKVDSVELKHEKDQKVRSFPCFGYVFEGKTFKFAYLSDFNKILEEDKVRNLDLLICDGNTMKQKKGHIGIINAIKLYKRIKPKRMLFTHINHDLPQHQKLEEYVKKYGNIGIAYDGMKIEVIE